jgi:enoyl-CoA hydratase/carnithine racemase
VVRRLKAAAKAFSAIGAKQRAIALLDDPDFGPPESAGTLLLGRGGISGCAVQVAVTDRRAAGGSLGVAESDALAQRLLEASRAREPVLLILDSAGARIDAGLPALGAFRRLYAAALAARVSGLPMIALIGRDCFGGASMLAMLCGARIYTHASRLAMSGPAIIEASAGRDAFDASDALAVGNLLGAQARAQIDSAAVLCEDALDDVRLALLGALATAHAPLSLDIRHRKLRERLHESGISVDERDLNFVSAKPVGAADCWALADRFIAGGDSAPPVLQLDSPGQAANVLDERLLLSEYVAHLALCVATAGARGHAPTLRITGDAAGGIYVALAAPAQRVEAVAGARIRLLPPAAEERVVGKAQPDASLEQALSAGVIDAIGQ